MDKKEEKDRESQLATINRQTIKILNKVANEKQITAEAFRQVAKPSFWNSDYKEWKVLDKYAALVNAVLADAGGTGSLEMNYLVELLEIHEQDIKAGVTSEIQTALNSQESGYMRFFNAVQQKSEEDKNDLELSIKAYQSQLEQSESKISDLEAERNFYKKQLSEYERERNNWSEIIRNRRHSIQSNEDFLNKSLDELNAKLHDLSTENLTKDEIILKLQENISNYSLFIKYCEKICAKLKNEIKLQGNLLADMDNNQMAWGAQRILLEGRILELENIIADYERQKDSAIKNFADYKTKIDKERLEHKRSEAENLKLENKISSLETENKSLQDTIDELGENINLWQAKSRKTIINFNFERNNLLEQLKTEKNISFTSKLKLRGVLTLDMARHFVYFDCLKNGITWLETAVFASEVTGWGTTFTWTSLWLVNSIIWILGFIKLFYWIKGRWISLFEKKSVKSTTLSKSAGVETITEE